MFAVRGPVILLGTPEDHAIIKFLRDEKFLPYVPGPNMPGPNRGLVAWQRDGIGPGQESIALIARAAVGPAERVLNMLGEQRRCALVYAAVFVLNLAGCFAAASPYGSVGVAIVISTTCVVESALLFLIAKRRLGLHMLIWRPRVPA